MSPILFGVAGVVGVGVLAFSGTADASIPSLSPNGDSGDSSSPVIDYSNIFGSTDVSSSNIAAFVAAVNKAESATQYNALVGGGTFSDYSHHPAFTDASNTTRTSWAGWHNSHAAGAAQFEPSTWVWVASSIGASDFTPDTQDQGAAWLANFYASAEIAAGDIAGACAKLASQWESIGVRGVAYYASAFTNAGGVTA